MKSCNKFMATRKNNYLTIGKTYNAGSINDWKKICVRAKVINSNKARKQFLEDYFNIYQVSSGKNTTGRFTGYYEGNIRGSLVRTSRYKYPIYGPPQNLSKLKPYYTRKQIEEGALRGKNLEILWTDDPIKLFSVHTQGSSIVHLTNGKNIRIGYAEQNGHKFMAIGRYMLDNKILGPHQISANHIKNWLYKNPKSAPKIMNINPSYVFFKIINAKDGPIGSQEVELIKLRSIAVDRNYYPLGLPAWVETKAAGGKTTRGGRLRRLVMMQDSGGAIKGPLRVDFFFGHGTKAQEVAGNMNAHGKIYVLIPKDVKVKNG
jgi:membrane-bound lytic murein transglycosylase A